MNIIKSILLVVFVIIAILLVLLVLVQNEEGNGMGSAFGGGQSAAFGSHSASILTKTTGVLVALFFIIIFAFSFLNRSVGDEGAKMNQAASEVQGSTPSGAATEAKDWFEEEAPAETSVPETVIDAGNAEVDSTETDSAE
jgi:preprotein translocase subunit SecG